MGIVELNRIIEKKGMDWLVAALIEGSIGYHSPKHAKILIERAVAGEAKDYCERCMACFNCDLMKMIERDVEIFERLEARDPQKSERIVSFSKQIANLDEEGQSLVSLAYPTMGVKMQIWRDLKPEEVKEFTQWALDNWMPDTQINNVWHPVVKSTWGKLDESFATAKRQILADYKDMSRRLHEDIE